MAQRGTYSQNNITGHHSPAPPPQYFQTRRSSHDAQMNYSSFGGYGPTNVGYNQDVQSVPISHRSRASFSRTHHSSYSADFPRTVHSSHLPTQTSSPAAWDPQQQSSYGYGQLPPYQGQPWQSPQHLPNPNAPYLGTVGANDELNRNVPHIATAASVAHVIHSPQQQWGSPSDPQSLYMYQFRQDDTQISPEMSLAGYSFSSVPSPSSSPSPSCGIDMSPVLGPRRASIDATPNVKRCSHCNATSTPLWRRNPMTMQPLCNACGLYLQQRNKLRPQELIDASNDDDESEDESDRDPNAPRCSHCQTHVTSVWRRSKSGEQLCNACGVYLRLRGKPRPLSLKQKKIKPRPHSSKHAAK